MFTAAHHATSHAVNWSVLIALAILAAIAALLIWLMRRRRK